MSFSGLNRNKKGIPVFVGEFGVYEKRVCEGDVSQFPGGAIELMKQHDLPRC